MGEKIDFDGLRFVLFMGPQRTGTSWLDRYFRSRDDLCVPSGVKEVFFFDRNYDRGAEFYRSHFNVNPEKHKAVVEVTTTAFDCEHAPKIVRDHFDQAVDFVCPLRHPVIRSYSLYKHYLRYGIVKGSLREACADYPQIIESSRYAKHLQRWYDAFPKERIRLMYQEDLQTNHERYVRDVCSALGVDYSPVSEEMIGRYNITTRAALPFLAGMAQNAGDFLRAHRLYDVVNLAKKAGLKRLIFGEERASSAVYGANGRVTAQDSLDDLEWLFDQLSGEADAFKGLVGGVPAWESYQDMNAFVALHAPKEAV